MGGKKIFLPFIVIGTILISSCIDVTATVDSGEATNTETNESIVNPPATLKGWGL